MITAFIPTFNSERTVLKTIESIKNQTLKPERIVVIDSGSTDNTENIVKSSGVEFFPPSYFGFDFLGLGRARNRILELMDTPYLLSVDSDIVLEKDHIEKMLPMFRIDKNIAGVAAKQIEFNRVDIGDRCRATVEMRDLLTPLKEQKPEFKDFLLGSNNIYKTEILKEIGLKESGSYYRPFNESLTTNYEDVDLGKKLNKYNYKLFYTPEVLTYHLQKDTLSTFMDRAYRYRVFKWELRGAFKNNEIYKGKMEHNINYTLMGLNIAKSKNRTNLIFPVITCGFFFFLKDVLKFQEYENFREAESVFNSVLKGLKYFNGEISSKIKELTQSCFAEVSVEKGNRCNRDIADILIFFKTLSETKNFDISEEVLTKSNVAVNFTEKSLKFSDKYVINYNSENYNIDELYFELLSLNPVKIEIIGDCDEEPKNIIQNFRKGFQHERTV